LEIKGASLSVVVALPYPSFPLIARSVSLSDVLATVAKTQNINAASAFSRIRLLSLSGRLLALATKETQDANWKTEDRFPPRLQSFVLCCTTKG
jgi:hypothetical protein